MEQVNLAEIQEKNQHNDIINQVIEKIENKKFNLFFYVPAMNTPSGGISVLIKQAKILKDNGYNVTLMYEPRLDSKQSYIESQKKNKKIDIYEKFNPTWMGNIMDGLQIKCLADGTIRFNDDTTEICDKIYINPEDMVIIPEGFPNIMDKFSNIPCKKIVFAQSWYYILNSLSVNQTWRQYGINDVISISDGITEYLHAIMPGMNIKQYSQSIDRNIFFPRSITQKYPKIAFMAGRSQEAVLKTFNVIKTFYCFYPQYKWVRFDELKGLSKEDFAERLGESAFVLYTDEIAGFGTLPLEAMACGTHVIGWNPLGGKEYIKENNGFWAQNGEIFQLADLIGTALDRYFSGLIDTPDIQAIYENTLSRYTPEKEKESIINIYTQYTNERISELQQLKQ